MEPFKLAPEERREIEQEVTEGAPFRRILRYLLATRKVSVSEQELIRTMEEWPSADPSGRASGLALLTLDFPRETMPLVYFLLECLASRGARRLLPSLLLPLGPAEAARLLLEVRCEGLATDSEIAAVFETVFGEKAAATYLEGR